MIRSCYQIVKGMRQDLALLKFVHRDLAARNVLVDAANNCKISDFGTATSTLLLLFQLQAYCIYHVFLAPS